MHLKGVFAEHESTAFQALILVIRESDGIETILTQSVAILGYLEEILPTSTPLMSRAADLVQRARIREMVNIISNDIQLSLIKDCQKSM
ncbi:maleylacetoacetate isomerase [Penicillium taxi]|uniref:maleylacetoacetate isomerase n=1 Tax=Penicillium taxi TaxID=168475 RepID=UPI0025455922|nr:maleylacetoacetate isomerase [Penicillium taxi]KAJ5901634.1 maleylacetoacetate isomerase [Penicillium taxi]